MNWLLIVVLIIIGGYTTLGYRRGFIKTVFIMFSAILAILIASIASPYLSKVLQSNDAMYQSIYNSIDEHITLSDTSIAGKFEEIKTIESLNIPSILKDNLKENNNKEIYDIFNITNFHDYVVTYITVMIFNGISYLIAYIIAIIILRILAGTLDIISKLPIIKHVNKIGGLCVGFMHGILVVWVFFIIITVFSNSMIGAECFDKINNSIILSSIYENNIILNYITDVAKSFFV